jgi:hypothetical protein
VTDTFSMTIDVERLLGKDTIQSWNSCRFVIRKRMQRNSGGVNANTTVEGGGECNPKIGIYKYA